MVINLLACSSWRPDPTGGDDCSPSTTSGSPKAYALFELKNIHMWGSWVFDVVSRLQKIAVLEEHSTNKIMLFGVKRSLLSSSATAPAIEALVYGE